MRPPKDPHYRTASAHVRYQRGLKRWRQQLGQIREQTTASEIDKIIERAASTPVERIPIAGGYSIEAYDAPEGDGRQKFKVYSPSGELLTMARGQNAAEAAVIQHLQDGIITHE